MTNSARKLLIDQLQHDKREIEKRLWNLIKDCPHEIDHGDSEYHLSDTSVCSICGQEFGWYCPKSPDHVCHYVSYEDNGKRYVGLVTGGDFAISLNWEPVMENETEDTCLFCGHPEERT